MRLDVITNIARTDFPELDPGFSALLASIITAVVAVIGHRVSVSKNKTEESATHVEGFQKLTMSLQAQIDNLQSQIADMQEEMRHLKSRKAALIEENQALRSEVLTKDEVIRGFARWIDLWEQWFKQAGESVGPPPPPDYTWQMKQYLDEAKSNPEWKER